MKIYGYEKGRVVEHSSDVTELAEITLIATPEELRKIARFVEAAADGIEKRGKNYSHEHLSDKEAGFENSPHLVIFNPDATS
jgi:hypothetical protein